MEDSRLIHVPTMDSIVSGNITQTMRLEGLRGKRVHRNFMMELLLFLVLFTALTGRVASLDENEIIGDD